MPIKFNKKFIFFIGGPAYNFSKDKGKRGCGNMTENNEPQLEPIQEPKKELESDFKNQIKNEIKKEMKQDFFHYKKKKFIFFLSLLIVFVVGLGIGFLAGHHDRGFRNGGYMMHGGYQMQMQHGHLGNQPFSNPNGSPGQ